MLTRWNDDFFNTRRFDEMFDSMSALRRTMDRLLDEVGEDGQLWTTSWPRVTLDDRGDALVLTAQVPGLSNKDIELSVQQGVLTLAGERKTDAPEGYSVHRQERPSLRFTRRVALPCAVDAERTSATVKNGILTARLEKAAEARPRQIEIKAS